MSKNKVSKTIALMLVLLMLLTSQAFAFTGTKADTKDFVKLTWYMPPPNADMTHRDSIMAEVNKQLKEKINAQVEFVFIDWGNYDNKMKLMSAAGDEYDLAFSNSWIFNFPQNVAKGAVIPLDGLLAKYGQNILKQVPKEYLPAVTFNKKIYGVIDLGSYASARGATVKKDLAQKYKLNTKSIKSLKDLGPFLAAVKKGEKGITPMLSMKTFVPMDWFNNMDLLSSCIIFDTADGKIKLKTEGKPELEAYRTLNDFYKKGFIPRDAALKKDNMAERKSGKYAVFADNGAVTDDGIKSTSAFGFPCVDINQGLSLITTGGTQATVTVISKSSKNPERAMMLMDLIYSDKYLFNTMCYGLEGQDYKVVSGKGTNNPTVEANTDMKWAIWHPWIGNLFNQWPSNWNSKAALDEMQRNNKISPKSPLLGFTFNPEPVKTKLAQIDAIWVQSEPILDTGSAPNVDKYIADMKAKMVRAGLNDVIKEMQNQIASWKKANGKK